MRKFVQYAFLLTALAHFFVVAEAQRDKSTELSRLLDEANETRKEYVTLFKNLSAEETKVIETFDQTGSLKKRREILSDLIIYESPKAADTLREYRNIRQIDAKPVKEGDRRVFELFRKLDDGLPITEDLERIENESQRYDTGFSIYGFTLFPAVFLTENLRPSFNFEIVGREQIKGANDTIVIGFQQIASNPHITVKVDSPDYLQFSAPLYRGKIWIDEKNKKIRRLIQELTVDSSRINEPAVVSREEFNYQPGAFDIYLPDKIISERFGFKDPKVVKLLLKKNEKINLTTYPATRLTMNYKNFRKFDVKVQLK